MFMISPVIRTGMLRMFSYHWLIAVVTPSSTFFLPELMIINSSGGSEALLSLLATSVPMLWHIMANETAVLWAILILEEPICQGYSTTSIRSEIIHMNLASLWSAHINTMALRRHSRSQYLRNGIKISALCRYHGLHWARNIPLGSLIFSTRCKMLE